MMQRGWKLAAEVVLFVVVPLLIGLGGCSCSSDPPKGPVAPKQRGTDWRTRNPDEQLVKNFSDSKKGTSIELDSPAGVSPAGVLHILELRTEKHFFDFLAIAPESAFQVTTFRCTATAISDAGMKHLSKFQNLKTLFLEATSISSAGMTEIKELKGLEEIFLSNTNVSDSGLADVAELPNLHTLVLAGCNRVSDEGMIHLTKMSQLRNLVLSETSVGDRGLFDLGQLQQLQTLNVERTKVTNEGVKNLKGMLPSTRIISDFFVPAIDPGTPPHLRGQ